VLRGEPAPDDLWAFSELARPPRPPLYAARVGNRKYVARAELADPSVLSIIYYDTETDSGEQHAKVVADTEAVAFSEHFQHDILELKSGAEALPRASRDGAPLDKEITRQLRALGYVD